ncbi:sulfatase [Calycomorphotria hydatis]|uniref:Arylsulfatase n=1 Tax=Calycomorphotria hydatis TaxID=2528027 RepID=A0A517TF36_9PLAN|nr:sulfatase [Calycomorphotria hydatis]QDT66983.1 Arylsulfatase [Calycomorphotria hydatis]
MKHFYLCAVLATLLGSVSHAADHPNIVFILADDLGCKDLSNEGSTYYESPNIDRIANEGLKFTHGYAACQVCSPSRASILTGKYPTNHGITNYIGAKWGEDWRKTKRHDSVLPPEYATQLAASEHTLAEVLKDAGYRTFFAGKWHLGNEGSWPTDHGFEINVGGYHAGGPYAGGYFAPWTNPNLEKGTPGEPLPVHLGKKTAEFIEANQDAPFLAYLSFYSVHSPIQTSEELWSKYCDKASADGLADSRFIFDRRLPVRQVQDCPIYAGMIELMDDGVGIVLDKLDELGLAENTIVCFTSDNGGVSSGDAYSTSNLPYRGGKGRQWEGGIREPFYIKAPGLTKAGTTNDTPVNGIDWYPTLLELANVDVPSDQQVDGVSFVPVLKGGEIAERPLFWHYPHYGNQGGEPSSIIIKDSYKLIFYHEDGRNELYYLPEDIGEQNDLAEKMASKTKSLREELNHWLAETNATFPIPDPQFDPKKRQQRLNSIKSRAMQNLEKKHAEYLSSDYEPNKDWWGSRVID